MHFWYTTWFQDRWRNAATPMDVLVEFRDPENKSRHLDPRLRHLLSLPVYNGQILHLAPKNKSFWSQQMGDGWEDDFPNLNLVIYAGSMLVLRGVPVPKEPAKKGFTARGFGFSSPETNSSHLPKPSHKQSWSIETSQQNHHSKPLLRVMSAKNNAQKRPI